jgi:hypothetical protein
LFVRRDTTYYPQAPINFDYDSDKLMWECPRAWLGSSAEGHSSEIVIADLSEDLMVATRHYNTVWNALHDRVKHHAWVGIQMDPVPPGFKRLAWLTIKAFE